MDCRTFRRLLRSRIAGELDGRSLASSRMHEEGCPGCRELHELQRSVASALLAYRGERLPHFVTDMQQWVNARKRA